MSGRVLIGGLVAALAAVPVATQQQGQPSFRSRLDLVHLDVSVLDRDRKPVRGLTAADFVVLEDGKPQPVSVFSAIDVPAPPSDPPAKWAQAISPDTQTNEAAEQPEGRLFVILIDDAMLPPEPGAIKNAKKIARGIVDRMGPLDQAAVVYTYELQHSQNFTHDRPKLYASIDELMNGHASHLMGWDTPLLKTPGMPILDNSSIVQSGRLSQVPAIDKDMSLRVGSLKTLRMVGETLVKAPQRRKALFYVSPGIGVDFEAAAYPAVAPNQDSADPGTPMRQANRDLARETPEVFRRLANANVTVYSIDPCGLEGLRLYVQAAAGGLLALTQQYDPVPAMYNWLNPSIPPRPQDLAKHMSETTMDFLVAASKNTGGRTVVNTNDFDPGLDSIFEENRSYYLLGYVKPTQTKPGHLHKLNVSIANRPELTVRTRAAYEVEKPDPKINDAAVTSMLNAANGPVALSGLQLSLAAVPVAIKRTSNGETVALTLTIGMTQPMVKTRTQQVIHFQAAVFTPDGRRVSPTVRNQLKFTLVPSWGKFVWYDALMQIPVKPGRYEVRVAAHRATDDVSGSVFADVEVPDFVETPISMSGVFITAMSGPTGVPRTAFADFVPVAPTASREFVRGDDLTAYFRVYQGGNKAPVDVPLAFRLTNEKDEVVATSTGTIAAAQFAGATRSADHRFALQLGNMRPGRYLVTFEATLGSDTARRDVIVTLR